MIGLRSIFVGVALAITVGFAQTGMVSGFVRDGSSGEFLGYVSVYLEDGSAGTATNRQGYYVLSDVPEGRITLVVSMIGYEEQRVEVEVKGGSRLRRDFYLKQAPLGMETVEITAERARFEHDVDVGIKRMDYTEFKQVPGFVEQDLFRSLEMLPGVISVSDFTSALYIRGGTADQNLVLLDGVTVYNPYHLLGFYSTFILDALKGAELYTGGFPARYGGAISSVLDVEMKAGNSERYTGAVDLGLLTSKAVLEGPLPWGKGSWLVAGRRTYIDLITKAADKIFDPEYSIYLPYHFYDLQAKINWDASEKSRFTVSGFFGDDVLKFSEEDEDQVQTSEGYDDYQDALNFRWGNGTLGFRWRYLFTPKLFSLLGFNATRYRINTEVAQYDSTGEEVYAMDLNSGIGELGLQWGLTWFTSAEHVVEFGLEGKGIITHNTVDEKDQEAGLDTTWIDDADTFWLAAAYIQDKWEPTPFWVIETGVRGEYFSNGDYWRISPRLGVKRRLTADWAVKASAGLYYQYLYVPYPRDEMMLKIPVQFFQQWIPVDSLNPPLRSALFTLGTEYQFTKGTFKDVNLSVEAYYKDMRNLRESGLFSVRASSDEEGTTVSAGFTNSDTLNGRGYSLGGEVMVKYKSSWIAYSLSYTKYKFPNTDWFFPVHDSRNNVNISAGIPLGKGWTASAAWVFSSGFPFTAQIGWYQHVGEDGEIIWWPISGAKGGVRYPAYHRLDAGFTKSFSMFKGKVDAEFYLQVLNVYARKNVFYYDYEVDEETGITYREPQYMIPFPFPSFGIRARF